MSRKVDALIAENIIGLERELSSGSYDCWVDELGIDIELPHYSTNIAHAWDVVAKFNVELIAQCHGGWKVTLSYDSLFYSARAVTVEMAICLAALDTKRIEL